MKRRPTDTDGLYRRMAMGPCSAIYGVTVVMAAEARKSEKVMTKQ